MKQLPTLYKRTKTGATQKWTIFIEGDEFYTESGQVDGKIVKSKPTKCKGKNVGRANETSPEDQALLEAQSKWDNKAKRKYTTDIESIDTACPFYEPMLAHKFDSVKDIKYPVYVQPKFDGIRAIITRHGAKTRNGEEHKCVPHILKELEPFFERWPNAILDGELYNHELHDDFNKIASLIRKQKPTTAQLQEAKAKVMFYCYDAPRLDDVINENTPFEVRNKHLHEHLEYIPCIHSVLRSVALSQEEVDALHDQYVNDGYEGAIIRIPGSPYEKGRSKNLLKYKKFDTEEFVLIDIREGKGNKIGLAAHADFETKDGRPFTANIKGKEWWRKELLENKADAIGKECTVEFFGYLPTGSPRFPYLLEIRDYE